MTFGATKEDREKQELMEEDFRLPYNPERRELDMRKLRATEVKSNKRVYLPKPVNDVTEEQILTRGCMIKKIVSDFIINSKTVRNIMQSEMRGVKKLRKRIKENEIIVFSTDKSGKLAVADLETYRKMGEVHVKGDKIVSWKVVEEAQTEVKDHLKGLNKVFRTGENFGEKQCSRTQQAKQAANLVLPLLYMMAKDHKETREGELPKCRPVCGASSTMNQEMSEWVSTIFGQW